MKQIYIYLMVLSLFSCITVDNNRFDSFGMGNPLLPGYFADPTIKKFGDTYYIYATTDGIKLASGEPQVWISKDFVNWYNYEMEIELPRGLTNCWAPDVLKGKDGRYYYFMGNCQFGCNIYGYVSDTPMGPWAPINEGRPIIPVGTGKEHLPALDAQFFQTDDGEIFAWFGTWCTSFGGLGWAELSSDDFKIEREGVIPVEELPEVFEAAYPLKKNGLWYIFYSSGDCRLSSYAVHYAWSENPFGPFHYGVNNPILSSSHDGKIDSPGHNSILEEQGKYYILYHRHDNPHSSGGEFRQVCVDPLIFKNDTTIEIVNPSHQGVGYLSKSSIPLKNLAFKAKTTASSYYHLSSAPTNYEPNGINHSYRPEYATDDNNGTIWKAESGRLPQSLTIDLGKKRNIKRILTQFEYPTYYYQYKWEVSVDGNHWILYSDKTSNRTSGSPMIDDGNFTARFVRITITGTEKTGMFAAIWNIKIYDKLFELPTYANKESKEEPGVKVGNRDLLVDLNIKDESIGRVEEPIENKGMLGGVFIPIDKATISVTDGVKSINFTGDNYLKLSEPMPQTLSWNAPFTIAAWVYNPEIGTGECVVSWTSRSNMLQSSYAAMYYGSGPYGAMAHGDGYVDLSFNKVPEAGEWHHIAVTFDGMCEYIYVNGKLDRQFPLMLFVDSDRLTIGSSGLSLENFSGSISSIRLYDGYSTEKEIEEILHETLPFNKE